MWIDGTGSVVSNRKPTQIKSSHWQNILSKPELHEAQGDNKTTPTRSSHCITGLVLYVRVGEVDFFELVLFHLERSVQDLIGLVRTNLSTHDS